MGTFFRGIRWSIVLLGVVWSTSFGGAVAEEGPYAVFAPSLDPADTKALAEIISPGKPDDVQIVDNLQAAARSDANVLVIFADRDSLSAMEESAAEVAPRQKEIGTNLKRAARRSELEPLRSKKVIGIGYGAAQLFDRLGLEIRYGACATIPLPAPEIELQANPLCPGDDGERIVAFCVPDPGNGETMDVNYNFAMYMPRLHEDTKFVDAIARWRGDENYAPIVRQGNYVMIGLAAPPSTWTSEYKAFLHDLTSAFADAPNEPFSTAKFAIAKPGDYEFELAQGRSTTELSGRNFYFRFAAPVEFSAKLAIEDSQAVMLLFRGRNGEHFSRKDGGDGKTLEVEAKISQSDLQASGEGYWQLEVTNFDRANRAKCKLQLKY